MMGNINNKNARDLMLTDYQFALARENLPALIMGFNAKKLKDAKEGDTISLLSIQAKQMKRFRLVHSCARCDNPHLHRRAEDECLGEEPIGPEV
jgi:hypothetical protein